jgi:hypothetical protein
MILRLKFAMQTFCWLAFISSCQPIDEPLPVAPEPIIPVPDNKCSTSFKYGYLNKQSFLPGEKVKTYLQASENISLCKLIIYDINGKEVFSIASPLSVQQVSSNDPSVNGFGFNITSEFVIPINTKSGVYLIERQIPLIIKNVQATDITVVYPSNTVNAYSSVGGKSLYDKIDRPSSVSFERPLSIQSNIEAGLKWFSTLSQYNINYISDADLDDYNAIQNTRLLVIGGHSEYWTRKARLNFDRFIDNGKSALILSGNTMWWQVRYEGNKMICYRDADKDPVADALLKTINWDQASLNYSITASIGADFPRGGYGMQLDTGWDGFKITNPSSPLLEGLNLKKGDVVPLPSGEYDGAPIAYFNEDGFPVLDNSLNHFYRLELIGYDHGSRFGKETNGTFIVFQKNLLSGIIVNGASYGWCSDFGIGNQSGVIRNITLNAISKLLNRAPVFSATNG